MTFDDDRALREFFTHEQEMEKRAKMAQAATDALILFITTRGSATQTEVGEVLGISQPSVAYRVARARRDGDA